MAELNGLRCHLYIKLLWKYYNNYNFIINMNIKKKLTLCKVIRMDFNERFIYSESK